MTRKDYELIAQALEFTHRTVVLSDDPAALATWEVTVCNIAASLADTNPRFDKVRFYNACQGV